MQKTKSLEELCQGAEERAQARVNKQREAEEFEWLFFALIVVGLLVGALS